MLVSLFVFDLDNPFSRILSMNESITFQVPAVKCNGFIHSSKIFFNKNVSLITKIISFII